MDGSAVGKMCRLCLNVSTKGFKILDETVQSDLNSLLIYPNLMLTEEPSLCESCTDTLKNCIDFKAKCLRTEDCIISLVCSKDTSKVDLRDVFKSEMANSGISDLKNYDLCRFCLVIVNGSSLAISAEDTKMVKNYFPELDLDNVQQSMTCRSCHESLRNLFNFVKSCMQIEEKIIEYCKVDNVDSMSQVDLRNVYGFIPKNKLQIGDKLHTIKIERKDVKTEEALEYSCELMPANSVKVEQEIDVKMEYEEVKIEPTELLNIDSPQTSPQQTYKCELCRYTSKRLNNFKRHVISHKSVSELGTYPCNECLFEAKSKMSLYKHELFHDKMSKMYRCTQCDFETPCKRNLRNHLRVHEDTSTITLYRCEQCPFVTKHKNNVKKHMQLHENKDKMNKNDATVQATPKTETVTYKTLEEATYCCTDCKYKTKYHDDLQKHTALHKSTSDVKVYKCSECMFTTRYKHNIRSHMLVHDSSGVSVHKCTECDYETKHKNNIKKHMIIHKNDKEVSL